MAPSMAAGLQAPRKHDMLDVVSITVYDFKHWLLRHAMQTGL